MVRKKKAERSLTALAGLSAVLQVGGGAISTVIRLGSSAVLARLLNPVDFGILGVGIIALEAIAHLGNMGINAGVISKKELSEADLSTGFWVMLANRTLLFTLSYLAAPLIAMFFREPRVTNVFRVCSIVFFFSAFDSIPRALITKKMDYVSLSLLQIGGSLLEGIVAIWLAATTNLRYWALIIGMLTTYSASLIFLYALTKWRPTLNWSRSSLRYFKSFMMNGVGASIVLYLKNNIDYLIVGRLLGVRQLGFYEFAYKVPNSFVQSFIMPLSNILHPLLAKVQDSNETVAAGYLRAMRLINIISFPALLGLASVADLLVPVLWGDKWLPIVVPLKILCFAGLVNCICAPIEFLFLAKQRPDLVFRMHLSTFLSTAAGVSVLGYFWGLNGIALGMALGTLPGFYFIFVGCKIITLSSRAFFLMVLEILVLASTSAGASFATVSFGKKIGLSSPLLLVASISIAACVYLVLLWQFNKRSLNELILIINETIGKEIIRPLSA